MYAWYQRARTCYAYLADVQMVEDEHGNWENSRAEFRRSAWFTRGWTLQELLAPSEVLFLDRHWVVIGVKVRAIFEVKTRADGTRVLNEDVSFVTGITIRDLWLPRSVCVARKFSWVSRRETTRVEDMAYCMLGLCEVNMPLLYGEGAKAFMRLQMEIIESSDDESIFAWYPDKYCNSLTSILAPYPRMFAGSGSIVRCASLPGKLPFSMTNKGLQYQVPRLQSRHDKSHKVDEKYVLLLDCCKMDKTQKVDDSKVVSVRLRFDGKRWSRSGLYCMELNDRSLWTNIVESTECTYETLYISTMEGSVIYYGDEKFGVMM